MIGSSYYFIIFQQFSISSRWKRFVRINRSILKNPTAKISRNEFDLFPSRLLIRLTLSCVFIVLFVRFECEILSENFPSTPPVNALRSRDMNITRGVVISNINYLLIRLIIFRSRFPVNKYSTTSSE